MNTTIINRLRLFATFNKPKMKTIIVSIVDFVKNFLTYFCGFPNITPLNYLAILACSLYTIFCILYYNKALYECLFNMLVYHLANDTHRHDTCQFFSKSPLDQLRLTYSDNRGHGASKFQFLCILSLIISHFLPTTQIPETTVFYYP